MAMTIGLCSAWFAPRNSVSDLLFTVVSKYSHSGIMWSTWRLLDPPPYVSHISVIDYCTSGLCQVHSTALGLAQLVTCVVSEFATLLGVCVRRNRIGFVALLSFFGAISAMAWTSEPAGELVDPPMCTTHRKGWV